MRCASGIRAGPVMATASATSVRARSRDARSPTDRVRTARAVASAPSGRASGARRPSTASWAVVPRRWVGRLSACSEATRAVRTSSHAKRSVSMPLHANHANAPKTLHIAPAAKAPVSPTRPRPSRQVSYATAACSTVPKSHATHTSCKPCSPAQKNGTKPSGHAKLVAPDEYPPPGVNSKNWPCARRAANCK